MEKVFEAQEAKKYEAWLDTPAGAGYVAASCALLNRVLDCRPGWRVLDVGCGAGIHLAGLMERGLLASGLEAGPVMAKIAQGRLGEKADIKVGEAHDLPYEDNSFDAVILVNTLELVERRAQVVAEAARVAASRVCLVSSNLMSPGWMKSRLSRKYHVFKHGRPLSVWSLAALIKGVLGPVPRARASTWPVCRPVNARWPFGSLIAVSAAVTPRYRTRPLAVTSGHATAKPRPATAGAAVGRGGVSLERVK